MCYQASCAAPPGACGGLVNPLSSEAQGSCVGQCLVFFHVHMPLDVHVLFSRLACELPRSRCLRVVISVLP